MKNENKLDQMCVILDHLQKYCPCDVTTSETKLADGSELQLRNVKLYELGIGGDQLTCEQVRGAQGL